MPRTQTSPYDTADYLTSVADCASYLRAVLEDRNIALTAIALRNISRAGGRMLERAVRRMLMPG